ncbi:cytochrome P450 [Gymnopus androsaceus JB14]|uniref:Cytochrome P450 n=1 Tax=Gymnopus androsaceus JB14 TaxID=1447944 RepID=A0A6A4I8X4_9AGAR|nr:cytochrome P450 [Gymnopus androsaceus JB14]
MRGRNPLPPGPWSFPLIGNTQCLISSPTWITYTEWYQKYNSDIVHVNIAGKPVIILNTLEAARELLERKSGIYSSRPQATMLNDLIGWSWAFSMMPYGREWKACRRLFTTMFNPSIRSQHEPQELRATRIFLLRLHETPEDYATLLRKMAGSAILSVAYGFDIEAAQDSVYTKNAQRASDGFIAASMPGTFLVDSFSWLKYVPSWFPGAGFQRQARIWKDDMEISLHAPFDSTKSSIIEGGHVMPCFVSRCLEKLGGDLDSNVKMDKEWLIKQTAGTMYIAGTDTTVAALLTFFLAMVKWPEYQRKAQKELDRVIGSERLPDFDDRENLPYIQAIVNEILRWQPVTPLALARISTEDNIYNGYHIPKNATVIPNVWAMFHDEKNFVDPYTFNPDRYIRATDGQLNFEVLEPTAGFGFGRRTCPASHMALSAIWITIASVLAVYNISNALDEDSKIIIPAADYETTKLQNRPYPFKCSIRLRSPERLHVMRAGAEEGK